jgi:hypothetical protein
VPKSTYVTNTRQGQKILAIELMGVRSNYKTQKVEDEYESPPRNGGSSTKSGSRPTVSSGNTSRTTQSRTLTGNGGQTLGNSHAGQSGYQNNSSVSMTMEDEDDLRLQREYEIQAKAAWLEHQCRDCQRNKEILQARQKLEEQGGPRDQKSMNQLLDELRHQKDLKEAADDQKEDDMHYFIHRDNSDDTTSLSTLFPPKSVRPNIRSKVGNEAKESQEERACRRQEIQERCEAARLKREEEERRKKSTIFSYQSLSGQAAEMARQLAAKKQPEKLLNKRTLELLPNKRMLELLPNKRTLDSKQFLKNKIVYVVLQNRLLRRLNSNQLLKNKIIYVVSQNRLPRNNRLNSKQFLMRKLSNVMSQNRQEKPTKKLQEKNLFALWKILIPMMKRKTR